jgi:hypothetical protein
MEVGKTLSKPDSGKVADEIKDMRKDIKSLEKALGELVDALISEEKPGPKEIKKLTALKKKANDDQHFLETESRRKIAANKSDGRKRNKPKSSEVDGSSNQQTS